MSSREIWIVGLTPRGVELACRLARQLEGGISYSPEGRGGEREFGSLDALFAEAFRQPVPLVCVMAAGIVVRTVAPFLRDKMTDPPVVVVDELGRYAVSLLSGHFGGANRLALEVAEAVGAAPVITTATDINGLPPVDLIAREAGCTIENRDGIAKVAMAMLRGEKIGIHDPLALFTPLLAGWDSDMFENRDLDSEGGGAGIYVSEKGAPGSGGPWLILRPRILVAGVGCNRGAASGAILGLLREVFMEEKLSLLSLKALATIDIKGDEPGLAAAAHELGVELLLFPGERLSKVEVPAPSPVVERHVGTRSVCEAAAILGSGGGELIVGKRKSPDVTVAVARSRIC